MAKIIVLILALTLVGYLAFGYLSNPSPTDKVEIKIKDKTFNLEIARTLAQKSKGLMNRNSLAPDSGMIFVSSTEMPQSFWMKNTLIPLDMIFLNKDGVVINIETAVPEPDTPSHKLKLYQSAAPAKYVIELNAGTSQTLHLVPGDIINLNTI